jgi:hypothetical protein
MRYLRCVCLALLSVLALVTMAVAIGGCASAPKGPPEPWAKLASGRISGDRSVNKYLGTYALGSRVRLAWVLSGPQNPPVTLVLKGVGVHKGYGFSNAILLQDAGAISRRDEHGLGFIGVEPDEYRVYLVQRFRRGQGPGFDIAFTLYTMP